MELGTAPVVDDKDTLTKILRVDGRKLGLLDARMTTPDSPQINKGQDFGLFNYSMEIEKEELDATMVYYSFLFRSKCLSLP